MYDYRSEWEEFWRTATVSTPTLGSYVANNGYGQQLSTPLYNPYKSIFDSLGQQPKSGFSQFAYYTTKDALNEAQVKSKVQSKVYSTNTKKSNKLPYYGSNGDISTTQYRYNDLYAYTKSYQLGE